MKGPLGKVYKIKLGAKLSNRPFLTQTDMLAFGLAHVPRFHRSLGDGYPGVLCHSVKRHRGGRPHGFAIYTFLLYSGRQGPYFVALGMYPPIGMPNT